MCGRLTSSVTFSLWLTTSTDSGTLPRSRGELGLLSRRDGLNNAAKAVFLSVHGTVCFASSTCFSCLLLLKSAVLLHPRLSQSKHRRVKMDFSQLHTYTPPQCAPENTGYTYSLR